MATTRRSQITIRTLLLVTFLSAVAVVVWLNRPSGQLAIEITQDGVILLDGQATQHESLRRNLNLTSSWHNLWRKNCKVTIFAKLDTPRSVISEIVDDARSAGLQVLSVSYPPDKF